LLFICVSLSSSPLLSLSLSPSGAAAVVAGTNGGVQRISASQVKKMERAVMAGLIVKMSKDHKTENDKLAATVQTALAKHTSRLDSLEDDVADVVDDNNNSDDDDDDSNDTASSGDDGGEEGGSRGKDGEDDDYDDDDDENAEDGEEVEGSATAKVYHYTASPSATAGNTAQRSTNATWVLYKAKVEAEIAALKRMVAKDGGEAALEGSAERARLHTLTRMLGREEGEVTRKAEAAAEAAAKVVAKAVAGSVTGAAMKEGAKAAAANAAAVKTVLKTEALMSERMDHMQVRRRGGRAGGKRGGRGGGGQREAHGV
jgi:hypothetical protein